MINMTEGNIEGFRVKFVHMNNLIIGITTDIGPRIIYLAHKENPDVNLFGVVPDFSINTSEGKWRIFGGHRLWVSPEAMPRSYSLDDKPIRIRITDSEVIVEGNPEPHNSIKKRILIRPISDNNSIEVVHEIENIGRWPIKFACWAISVMRRNGFAIVPIKPNPVDEKGLLPDRIIVLWPYTNISDERLILGKNYIFVKQDPNIKDPLKIGVRANPPYVAYWIKEYLFVKKISIESNAEYPDFQSNVEVYTNNLFLELETLGPLREIEPGEVNRHSEIWKVISVGELKPLEEDVTRIENAVNQ